MLDQVKDGLALCCPSSITVVEDITPEHLQRTGTQNAYVERYNRTVRTEWLGRYHFDTIEEVQDHATRWLWTHNNERPNMGIGGLTPIQKLKAA